MAHASLPYILKGLHVFLGTIHITFVSSTALQNVGPVHTYPDIFESTFFLYMASVHMHPTNSTVNPDIVKSALQSGKHKSSTNPITCGQVNPDIF